MKLTITAKSVEQDVIPELERTGCTVTNTKSGVKVEREFSDAEMLAFNAVALSPIQWIMNMARHRCRIKGASDICEKQGRLNPKSSNVTQEEVLQEIERIQPMSVKEKNKLDEAES